MPTCISRSNTRVGNNHYHSIFCGIFIAFVDFVVFCQVHIKREEGNQGIIKLLDEIIIEHKYMGHMIIMIWDVIEWFKNLLTYHTMQSSIGCLWMLCQHWSTL